MARRPPEPPPPPPEIPPPAGLSARAAQLWRDLVPLKARAPARLTLLESALRCMDRADEVKAVIDREGLTVTSKAGLAHVHPLLRVEKDMRTLFGRLMSDLGLRWDPHGF